MSNTYRGLDLYCCSGGCSVGYTRAGFSMVGSDIDPQPNYPYGFIQMDAIELLRRLIDGERFWFGDEMLGLSDFDFIHASPPCQDYTTLKAVHGNEWPRLIEPTRDLLIETGLPYIIENVVGAKRNLIEPIRLCGEMFGLAVLRHRLFETHPRLPEPPHPKHRGKVKGWRHGQFFDGPYFAVYGEGGGKGTVAQWQQAMGIDWTTDRREIAEAIPPAYAEHLGRALLTCHLSKGVQS